MRPVIEKRKLGIRHVIYGVILVICVISVGIAIYMQFYRDANLKVVFGITTEDEAKQEYIDLKANFLNIFDNKIEIVQNYNGDVKKIREQEELVLVADEVKETTDNYSLDLKIPYFNIDSSITRTYNEQIRDTFAKKADSVVSLKGSDSLIIYNVKYKTYIYNDIISLVIMSELKEGENSQRIIIETYNYNLKENREISIQELLGLKSLNEKDVNDKIKKEIDEAQEQNIRLKEAGYNVNVRDSSAEIYKINNAKQFFIGKDGYLYVLYPYGNDDFTSQMDIVIFK